MDLLTDNKKVVTKEDVAEGLKEIVTFQNKEMWRMSNWQVNFNSLVNLEGFEKSIGDWDRSEVSKSDVLLSVSKGMIGRKYLLVQQFSNEKDYSGQIPVTIGLATGKDIKGLFSVDNLSNSYVYGPSLAIENDAGYDSGTQFLLDVTNVDNKNLKALVQSAREKLDEVQEKAYRYLEGGNDSSYDRDYSYGNRRYEGYDDAFNRIYDNEDDYGRRNESSSEAYQEFIDKAVKAVVTAAYENDARSPYNVMLDEFARVAKIDLDKLMNSSKAKQAKEAQQTVETKKVVTKEQPKVATATKTISKPASAKTVNVQKATYKKAEPKKMEEKIAPKVNTVAKPVKEMTVSKVQPKVELVKMPTAQPVKTAPVKNSGKNNKIDNKGVVVFIKPGITKAIREKGSNGKSITKEFVIEGYSDDRIKNGTLRFAVNDEKNNVTAKQLYTSAKFRNWTVVNGNENSTVTVTYETKMNHATVIREESLDIYKFQAWVKERNKEQVKNATKSGVTDGNSGRGE